VRTHISLSLSLSYSLSLCLLLLLLLLFLLPFERERELSPFFAAFVAFFYFFLLLTHAKTCAKGVRRSRKSTCMCMWYVFNDKERETKKNTHTLSLCFKEERRDALLRVFAFDRVYTYIDRRRSDFFFCVFFTFFFFFEN
jgi:hypothetical protein